MQSADDAHLSIEHEQRLRRQLPGNKSSYTLAVTTTRGRIYDRRMQPLTDTEQHDLIAVFPPAHRQRRIVPNK